MPATLDPKVGTVCGKLLTMRRQLRHPREARWWIPPGSTSPPCCATWIAAARKWTTATSCNYEYVFGATAAAALYRREMIEDISIDGEFFDPDFFVYREDADVAWRAQLMGWRCLYTPHARGYHVRNVLPGNRRALPPKSTCTR